MRFSRLFRGHNSSLCCVELIKLLPEHRYSIDIFSYAGPSGLLGSDGMQNTTCVSARGMRIVALSISSHEQTQLNRVCCFLKKEVLSITEGSVFPDYLEVTTAVVVLRGFGKTSPRTSIEC